MAYSVKILLDSINTDGDRLTTWELTYPRFIHSEFMTHRAFSRNAASSRAIPIAKMIERVKNDPAMPVYWGKNQPGMQADEELEGPALEVAKMCWLDARDKAVASVEQLMSTGAHKQIANRILEPWMYITVIMSATSMDNFFDLRCDKAAQPEFKKLADMMKVAYNLSKPELKQDGDWHIPMILPEEQDLDTEIKIKISIGRCARVSYLTHDGKRDHSEDIKLYSKLLESKHMSPFEHVAQAISYQEGSFCFGYGNFEGWKQARLYVESHQKLKEALRLDDEEARLVLNTPL